MIAVTRPRTLFFLFASCFCLTLFHLSRNVLWDIPSSIGIIIIARVYIIEGYINLQKAGFTITEEVQRDVKRDCGMVTSTAIFGLLMVHAGAFFATSTLGNSVATWWAGSSLLCLVAMMLTLAYYGAPEEEGLPS